MPATQVLVTGGFGFIGSHLIERLGAEPDHHLTVVDNLTSSPLPLDCLLGELGTEIDYTIADAADYAISHRSPRFDEIYHLASFVGPAGILAHGGTIVPGVVRTAGAVADLAMRCGARLVYVSTSEVYGGGVDGHCSETTPRRIAAGSSIRREYAAAKIAAELMLANLADVAGLDVRIVRPFNVAGPRQSGQGGFVVPRFVAQCLTAQPLTVFGTGRQVRAFTHVREIADGLVRVMRSSDSGATVNLGNPANRITILELAELVVAVTGSPSPIRFVDPRRIYGPLYDEADDKYPDATWARDRLGWQPQLSCHDIVAETVTYFESLPPTLRMTLGGRVPV